MHYNIKLKQAAPTLYDSTEIAGAEVSIMLFTRVVEMKPPGLDGEPHS